ncbi:MAG: magnesium/cobalt transporter CorA [Methyloligellaceae bacterium]
MTEPLSRRPRAGATRRRRGVRDLRPQRQQGAAPGTLAPRPDAGQTRIEVIAYGPETIVEEKAVGIEAIGKLRAAGGVLWVSVTGLGDVALIEALGEAFGLHRLALEDVINAHQRPKAEAFDDHVFIVARAPVAGHPGDSEQFCLFVGEDFVLTFQEQPVATIAPVRNRLRQGGGRLRKSGPDYLAYALIDAIIDGYFPLLEHCGDRLEDLEDEIVTAPDQDHVSALHELKRELLMIRRLVWPMREMINSLIRDEQGRFSETTRLYLRDCYDHAIQLMDITETYREIATGLLDIYISSISAKMNEVMKILTIIATIFMPLAFITGIYGMNFDTSSPWNMPELRYPYGYPVVLLSFVVITGAMLVYFRRKGWLGERGRNSRK